MSTGALIFMLVSWTAVLGTMVWSFAKILRIQAGKDADGNPRV